MAAAAANPVSRDTIYAEVRLNQQLRRLEQESIFSWPLAIGFLIGIFVVLAGAPTMLIIGSYMDKYSNEKKARQASFSVEKEMEKPKELTPEEEEQLLKLGIDDGTEKSTMPWIGYKEYQEQFAKKSEVEQPAIKETDAGRRPAKPTTAATISVLRTGKIYFNREEVEMKDVEVKVREAKAADPKTVVYLAIEDGQGVTDRAPILQDLWDRLQDEGVNIQLVGGAKASKQ